MLYNSWEATHFDVRVEQQLELARRAAAMGVELFVVDDGWFGARDNDRAGLGDWTVNPRKFPNGLGALIDAVHGLGMQFGIWVEPEMVNPDSDLYRAHPDWAYPRPDGREPTFGRNQLVLNFAPRRRAGDDPTSSSTTCCADHGTIDFIKWDHNRPGPRLAGRSAVEQQREVWVRHVRGLYERAATRCGASFRTLLIEIVRRRRRAGRPGHPALDRPGLDQRQHRRRRPAADPARLQPRATPRARWSTG